MTQPESGPLDRKPGLHTDGLTRAEHRARFIGGSIDRDAEDVQFWQRATDVERGAALYELLAFTRSLLDSGVTFPADDLQFPGFHWRKRQADAADR